MTEATLSIARGFTAASGVLATFTYPWLQRRAGKQRLHDLAIDPAPHTAMQFSCICNASLIALLGCRFARTST